MPVLTSRACSILQTTRSSACNRKKQPLLLLRALEDLQRTNDAYSVREQEQNRMFMNALFKLDSSQV
jgi:hypothetical protein